MENQEIINDEVIEATEDVMEAGLSKGFKVTIGIGLAVLAGGLTYKYAVKPMIDKIKAKREEQKTEEDCDDPSYKEEKK